MAFVYITCKNKNEAKKISKELINKNLIACANFFPIESMYRWKGKIVEDSEYVVMCKTIKKKIKLIENAVKRVHSYEIPCICLIRSEETSDFGAWVKDNCKK